MGSEEDPLPIASQPHDTWAKEEKKKKKKSSKTLSKTRGRSRSTNRSTKKKKKRSTTTDAKGSRTSARSESRPKTKRRKKTLDANHSTTSDAISKPAKSRSLSRTKTKPKKKSKDDNDSTSPADDKNDKTSSNVNSDALSKSGKTKQRSSSVKKKKKKKTTDPDAISNNEKSRRTSSKQSRKKKASKTLDANDQVASKRSKSKKRNKSKTRRNKKTSDTKQSVGDDKLPATKSQSINSSQDKKKIVKKKKKRTPDMSVDEVDTTAVPLSNEIDRQEENYISIDIADSKVEEINSEDRNEVSIDATIPEETEEEEIDTTKCDDDKEDKSEIPDSIESEISDENSNDLEETNIEVVENTEPITPVDNDSAKPSDDPDTSNVPSLHKTGIHEKEEDDDDVNKANSSNVGIGTVDITDENSITSTVDIDTSPSELNVTVYSSDIEDVEVVTVESRIIDEEPSSPFFNAVTAPKECTSTGTTSDIEKPKTEASDKNVERSESSAPIVKVAFTSTKDFNNENSDEEESSTVDIVSDRSDDSRDGAEEISVNESMQDDDDGNATNEWTVEEAVNEQEENMENTRVHTTENIEVAETEGGEEVIEFEYPDEADTDDARPSTFISSSAAFNGTSNARTFSSSTFPSDKQQAPSVTPTEKPFQTRKTSALAAAYMKQHTSPTTPSFIPYQKRTSPALAANQTIPSTTSSHVSYPRRTTLALADAYTKQHTSSTTPSYTPFQTRKTSALADAYMKQHTPSASPSQQTPPEARKVSTFATRASLEAQKPVSPTHGSFQARKKSSLADAYMASIRNKSNAEDYATMEEADADKTDCTLGDIEEAKSADAYDTESTTPDYDGAGERQSDLLCGFCCDAVKTTLVVDIIYIVMNITLLILPLVSIEDFNDSEVTGLIAWLVTKFGIGIIMASFGIFGALRFQKWLVLLAGIWLCIDLIFYAFFDWRVAIAMPLFIFPHCALFRALHRGKITSENYKLTDDYCCGLQSKRCEEV